MGNFIAIIIILAIVGGATLYIYKKKKRGGCIGCPYAEQCRKNSAACRCSTEENESVNEKHE